MHSNNKKNIDVWVMDFKSYYTLMRERFGGLFLPTDTKYPVFLARGFTNRKIIYILKGNEKNKKLVYHEAGHCIGLKHTKDRKNIMFPWFFRGQEGLKEIKDRVNLTFIIRNYK